MDPNSPTTGTPLGDLSYVLLAPRSCPESLLLLLSGWFMKRGRVGGWPGGNPDFLVRELRNPREATSPLQASASRSAAGGDHNCVSYLTELLGESA